MADEHKDDRWGRWDRASIVNTGVVNVGSGSVVIGNGTTVGGITSRDERDEDEERTFEEPEER